MARKTINAKEILADIKAGMDDSALMDKYKISEKGLQRLFKKLVGAGVLKQRLRDMKGDSIEPIKEPEKQQISVKPLFTFCSHDFGTIQIEFFW